MQLETLFEHKPPKMEQQTNMGDYYDIRSHNYGKSIANVTKTSFYTHSIMVHLIISPVLNTSLWIAWPS